jgi:hypothetical protein
LESEKFQDVISTVVAKALKKEWRNKENWKNEENGEMEKEEKGEKWLKIHPTFLALFHY